jgi:hypothetical protein
MKPKGSLPHSQVPATCLYPEPAQSSPYPHIPLPEDAHIHTHHKMHMGADDSTVGTCHRSPPQASMDYQSLATFNMQWKQTSITK